MQPLLMNIHLEIMTQVLWFTQPFQIHPPIHPSIHSLSSVLVKDVDDDPEVALILFVDIGDIGNRRYRKCTEWQNWRAERFQ